MKTKRVIVGALFAPLLIPILYFATSLLTAYPEAGADYTQELVWTSVVFIAPLAYVGSFIAGIPAVWLLRRRERLRPGHCIGAAGAIGALEGVVALVTLGGGCGDSPGWPQIIITAALLAMLTAIVFCAMAGVWTTPIRH